jgi:hypothetical protein
MKSPTVDSRFVLRVRAGLSLAPTARPAVG